jgi:putative component of toxin-antitoxin plasmid stabilization module
LVPVSTTQKSSLSDRNASSRTMVCIDVEVLGLEGDAAALTMGVWALRGVSGIGLE